MILQYAVGEIASKAEKKSIHNKGERTTSYMFRFQPLSEQRRYPISIISDIKSKEASEITLDSFGKSRVVPRDTNVEDLLIFSFGKEDEQVVGLKVVADNARVFAYDYNKKNAFNMFLGVKEDGEVLSVTTKSGKDRTRNSKFTTYTISKKGDRVNVEETTPSTREERGEATFELNMFPSNSIMYSTALIRKPFSVIDDSIVSITKKEMSEGYIKLVTSSMTTEKDVDEVLDKLDDKNITIVVLIDQSSEAIKAVLDYLRDEEEVKVFNCVCYSNGTKELVQM